MTELSERSLDELISIQRDMRTPLAMESARRLSAIPDLVAALKNARSMLIAFGGDPRMAEDQTLADQIQLALLDQIDVALATVKETP